MRRLCSLCDGPLPHPRGVRPRHLRLLRRRDVHQGACDGSRRKVHLPCRDVELSRHVHRHHRVSALFNYLYLLHRMWREVMFSPASVGIWIYKLYRYVCEQLPGANSSPIVTKRHQSYPTLGRRGQGDNILEGQGQRSRSVGKVCALLSLSSSFLYPSLCLHHPTVSAKALCFPAVLHTAVWIIECITRYMKFFRSFVHLSGHILLPQYLMNGLSNLDETYREYSLAFSDDVFRFWRSKVRGQGHSRSSRWRWYLRRR